MKRLTQRLPDGGIKVNRTVYHLDPETSVLGSVVHRLAAYEDTGLTPQEIMDGKLLTGWIPVSEKLPKPGERVLTCVGSTVFEGFINQTGEWDRYDNIVGKIEELFGSPVNHWMPMPEPPKGE